MEKNLPPWKLIRSLPQHLNNGAVDRAVQSFVEDTEKYGQGINKIGLFNSTMQAVANACVLRHDGTGGDFWASIGDDGEIYAYALGKIVIDIDNRLTYWVTQGWIHPSIRHGNLKRGWGEIEKYARANLCHHLVNITDRNPRAYLRFLGPEWHTYSTILKKDLN